MTPPTRNSARSGPSRSSKSLPQRLHEPRAEELRRADAVQDEGPARGLRQRLRQELPEVVHLDAMIPQRLGERVVLFLRFLGPHHVVEQHLADVLRGQPGQLESGTMHDGLAELANLGLHVEAHGRSRPSVVVAGLLTPRQGMSRTAVQRRDRVWRLVSPATRSRRALRKA